MVKRVRKLRLHRRFKSKQTQAEDLGQQAGDRLEKHFFKRMERILNVRRFIFAWVFLVLILAGSVIAQTQGLSAFYQTLRPARGGTYSEGIVGAFTNANPIYATSSVDASVSKLVFSSLMKYDDSNKLVGDLAETLKANDSADTYTVKMRDDVLWHDGKPLTSEDVVFTYQTIQNPDAKSPLLPNWQGVKVKALSPYEVQFTLPHGLASFPHSLTNGIAPKHLLSDIAAGQLRSVSFNTLQPIGSGPFRWEAVQVAGNDPETREEQIGLIANDAYYKGAPYLERFLIRAFRSEDSLIKTFENGELNGAAGLDNLPDSAQFERATDYNVPLMGQTMVFFNNSEGPLSNGNIRRALVHGTNKAEVRKTLGYPVAKADSPLLSSHVGYNKKITQYKYNPARAKKYLAQAGYKKRNNQGYLVNKQGEPLTIRLHSRSNTQYSSVTNELQKQWKQIGVNLEVILQSDEDLQSTIAFHNYQALLYGISTGNDPDVYAYWHSSQADATSLNRLNFSEYKSDTADRALEGGRSRVSNRQRTIKYKPLLESWRKDAPALALYQPRYLYISVSELNGFKPTKFSSPTDRFASVHKWAILETRATLE